MAKMTTYHSTATVKARKISDKNGEDVVTRDGGRHGAKGDYVVEHPDGSVTLEEAESFEQAWKTGAKKRTNRRASSRPAESPVPPVAQDGDKSAAERVKAAQKAAGSTTVETPGGAPASTRTGA